MTWEERTKDMTEAELKAFREECRRTAIWCMRVFEERGYREEDLDDFVSCMKDEKGKKLSAEEREKTKEGMKFFLKLMKMH
jgi:hypothetical protein